MSGLHPHVAHVGHAAPAALLLLRLLRDERPGREEQGGHAGGILDGRAHDLRGVEDSGLEEILVDLRGGVEAMGVLAVLDPVDGLRSDHRDRILAIETEGCLWLTRLAGTNDQRPLAWRNCGHAVDQSRLAAIRRAGQDLPL